ncbi:MAG: hypothetical protein ACFFD2_27180 [Promethearchaeota archaeon]
MPEKEYSYNELDESAKIKAIFNMDQNIRAKLSIPAGARSVNRTLIVCIISVLDTVFNKNGKTIYFSKKYKEITPELIKRIYTECSNEIFRKYWAIKWIKGNFKSYLDGKTSLKKIKSELRTAIKLGVTQGDFENIMEDFESYRESDRFQTFLEILYGPEIFF